MRSKAFRTALCTFMLLFTLGSGAAIAVDDGSLKGTVTDPLGASVSGANVQLFRDGTRIKDTSTDGRGEFIFEGLAEGRYRVEVTASGFETRRTEGTFVPAGTRATVDVGLQISPIEQSVVVTAAATAVSEAQTGAAVTVLDSTTLESLGNTDLLSRSARYLELTSSRRGDEAARRRSSSAAAARISTRF